MIKSASINLRNILFLALLMFAYKATHAKTIYLTCEVKGMISSPRQGNIKMQPPQTVLHISVAEYGAYKNMDAQGESIYAFNITYPSNDRVKTLDLSDKTKWHLLRENETNGNALLVFISRVTGVISITRIDNEIAREINGVCNKSKSDVPKF